MKRFLTLAGLAAIAAPALAQSSVTLGGIADAAVRSVSNEGRGTVRSLVSGSNSTSRLVVRGVEDLGGGLSVSFHLEHGIAFDTGLPTGGFWDRRSTLSLVSKSLGELRLGRDYVPTYSAWVRLDPFSHVSVAGSNNLGSATPQGPIRSAFGSNPNTTVRASNAVGWFAPGGLGGFEGQLMVAAGEGATAANGGHKVTGLRLGWAGGALALVAAHTRTENELTASGRFQDTVLGGSWSFGGARANLAWRQFKQNQAEQTNLMLAGTYGLGAGEIKVSVIQVDMKGRVGATAIDANDAQQLGLGYVHNLSKRSALYATYSRIANDGAATFAVPGGPSGLAGGGRSTGWEAGLRHSF